MKSILLHVNDDAGMEARLQAAFDAARAFNGHITFLQAAPPEIFVAGDFFGGAYAVADLAEAVHQRQAEHREVLERRLQVEDVRWDWIVVRDDPANALAGRASLADLTIVSVPGDQAGEGGTLAADLVVTVRGPVLAVPSTLRSLDCGGIAVVGWNGSMEAAHALRMSLPLLARASLVRLVTVVEEASGIPPTAGAEYLSRHDVAVELSEWPQEGRSVTAALLDAARTLEADYIVAGAYGHSRFREAVLGGVTRDLLRQSNVPLILTH